LASGSRLFSLDEIADGFVDIRMFKPFCQFGIFGLTKPSQHMSDAGNEGKSAFEEQEDGGQEDEDRRSSATDNAGFIHDFKVLFHGGVGALGGGAEFLDFLVALGASGDFIDEPRMIPAGHVLDKSGMLL
jgi:hypothetical protein